MIDASKPIPVAVFQRLVAAAETPTLSYSGEELLAFVRESNRIEGIQREPTPEEYAATSAFLDLPRIEIADLIRFVAVCQPPRPGHHGARLRQAKGMNVEVGDHVPPPGGQGIVYKLQAILDRVNGEQDDDPWRIHCDYETLHPFTDGNGRSGRALWLWQMFTTKNNTDLGVFKRGFLRSFYYQTLAKSGR